MWVMLSDAFLSIVAKDCPRGTLLVRARRQGDIEKIFPKAKVKRSTATDYLFRAVIDREEVATALVGELHRVVYENFKSSVADKPLHDAYLRCWFAMSDLQPTKLYSGLPARGSGRGGIHDEPIFNFDDEQPRTATGKFKKKTAKPRRSLKRGS